MIKKWETVSSEHLIDLRIFNALKKKRINPLNNRIDDFVVLDSHNWVNIIPITKDNKIVMIEQYRHGSDSVTLEIPGGLIEKDEEPRIAAERECMEETGYFSQNEAILTGISLPNPAFLNNKCYSYLWLDCELKFEQNLDLNEVISVKEFSMDEILNFIDNGTINHSVILTAFLFYFRKFKI